MSELARSVSSDVSPDADVGALRQRAALGISGLLSVFAIWLCLPLVGGLLYLIFVDGARPPLTIGFVVGALAHATVWTAMTLVVFRITARFNVEDTGRGTRALVLVVSGIVVALLASVMTTAALMAIGFPASRARAAAPPDLAHASLRMMPLALLFYAATAFVGLLGDTALRARLRREEATRLRAQLAEARLQVLRTQLNPHFLFNTLNAVSGLMDEDPRAARRMIARLSELLRYALDGARAAEIPLQQELALVGRYLEIVEIRYQGLLETSVSVDGAIVNALVPNLILQPLAENAMQHGVGGAGGRGRIDVTAERSGDRLILRVLDTGGGERPHESPVRPSAGGDRVGGLGLRHTRERLYALYGDDQRLLLEPRSEGGMVAVIEMPFHAAPLTAAPDAPVPQGQA
ncbi:MAG TPA: histidine kinase [Gemmatimonadaceae bacterium]|jgi:signal transduction histidine kinase